jgi:hypothetical protein
MVPARRVKVLYWAARKEARDWIIRLSDFRVQCDVIFRLLVAYRRLRPRGIERARPATSSTAYGKRLLVVSYYAPPYKSALGTQRLAKFVKYLSKWGWQFDLITTVPSREDEVDSGLEPLPAAVNVLRLEQRMSALPRGLLVPDHLIHWVRPSLDVGRRLTSTHTPSAILATVPPYTNAIVAALLAGETGAPLIVDFRDPWTKIDGSAWNIEMAPLRRLSGLM